LYNVDGWVQLYYYLITSLLLKLGGGSVKLHECLSKRNVSSKIKIRF